MTIRLGPYQRPARRRPRGWVRHYARMIGPAGLTATRLSLERGKRERLRRNRAQPVSSVSCSSLSATVNGPCWSWGGRLERIASCNAIVEGAPR